MPFTAVSSRALKSFYKQHRDVSGWLSEFLVACKFLKEGWHLRDHRLGGPFAEVDLVFTKGDSEMILVEVKGRSWAAWQEIPIGTKQLTRLRRAHEHLASREDMNVCFYLALVDARGEVEFIEDIFFQ